jgi:hypothetical protein
MNALAYRAGYVKIGFVQKFGHRIPRLVLRTWIRRTPNETETLIEYLEGKIDVDRFDYLVDLELVLIRAYNRIGR